MANLKEAPKDREVARAKQPKRNTSILGQNFLFTPRVIEQQREAIRENATRMIEGMLAEDAPDLIQHLAYPLPVMGIANMLGIADRDIAAFKRWSDAIISNVGNTLIDPDHVAIEVVPVLLGLVEMNPGDLPLEAVQDP